MRTAELVTSLAGRLAVAGSIVATVLAAPSTAAAQGGGLTAPGSKAVIEIKTGLLAFHTGPHQLEVLLTEMSARVTSAVRVSFLNEASQVVFREDAVLSRSQPVHVVFPLNMPGPRVKLRMLVTVTRDPLAKSLPVLVLEDVNTASFTIEDRVSCSPPEEKDGATPYCPPPAMVRTFTAN